jgi:hypothetical protein
MVALLPNAESSNFDVRSLPTIIFAPALENTPLRVSTLCATSHVEVTDVIGFGERFDYTETLEGKGETKMLGQDYFFTLALIGVT